MEERAHSRVKPMSVLPGPPADVWNALALRSRNIFATHEWCECWWEHLGSGEPSVITDDAVDPRVIVPLFRSGRALRQLRFIGTGPADLLGPVCAPEHNELAQRLVRERLADEADWNVAVFHDVAVDGGWQQGLDAKEVRRVVSPVLRLETDDWETYLSGRSKNFREQVRRKRRKLEREHPSTVLRLADATTIARDVDTFFALHQKRWGDDAQLALGRQREFQVAFALRALDQGWLRLWLLEIDGHAAAVSLGYRFGADEYYYQSGRDKRFDHLSVGAVLMAQTIRHAIETGAQEYRLLRGDEDYKSRWSDTERSVHTVALSRGLLGATALRLAVRRAGR